ncbi:MAG TPA: signal recognition particle-docking protein FtsY, partial [Thermoplasmata archaeon]|nr:signal recognition particle-docking protein FtsY [Thermoplasmata archaeon]
AALSATFVTKKPILFVGVGQGYSDLVPFDPDWMLRRLFAEGAAA